MRTANGKIDARGPRGGRVCGGGSVGRTAGDAGARGARSIWQTPASRVGIHDNLFDLGGD
jgi:hypothetical protein